MIIAIRQSNPYAQQLEVIIIKAGLQPLNEATENRDLKLFLEEHVDAQKVLLNSIFNNEVRLSSSYVTIYQTFKEIINQSCSIDFKIAKERVVREVHSI